MKPGSKRCFPTVGLNSLRPPHLSVQGILVPVLHCVRGSSHCPSCGFEFRMSYVIGSLLHLVDWWKNSRFQQSQIARVQNPMNSQTESIELAVEIHPSPGHYPLKNQLLFS